MADTFQKTNFCVEEDEFNFINATSPLNEYKFQINWYVPKRVKTFISSQL